MSRAIVSINVGLCGNRVGYQFYEDICAEHGIDKNGSVKDESLSKAGYLNVYFNELSSKKHMPRSVFVDLDRGGLDSIRSGEYGKVYNPNSFISGSSGTGKNWAKGHYTEGSDLCDTIMDTIRNEAENCDCLHGFHFSHSLGGGTGSGLGTLLIQKIREEYCDRIMLTTSIVPSEKISHNVIETYNAALSIHQLVENTDMSFLIDNEALHRICYEKQQKFPSFGELNRVISSTLCGATSTLRFGGQVNSDLRKMCVNLVLFPRLHFFTLSHAPLMVNEKKDLSINEMIAKVFDRENMLCRYRETPKPEERERREVIHTVSIVFRGEDVSTYEIEHGVSEMKENHGEFVKWIPQNVHVSHCKVPPISSLKKKSATMIANQSYVTSIYRRISKNFDVLFKKKAFLHYFLNEGMDEMEFMEAKANIDDLMTEYYPMTPWYEREWVGEDSEEEEEGEL